MELSVSESVCFGASPVCFGTSPVCFCTSPVCFGVSLAVVVLLPESPITTERERGS